MSYLVAALAAISMSAHAHPKFQHVPSSCSKHFTIPMADRAIHVAYDSDRVTISAHTKRKLDWYVRCQWSTLHRPALRATWRTARRAWHQRMNPPWSTAYVSYYNDAGTHCCGFYSTYGVAVCGSGGGPCVPMGTQIEFCDDRCVIATADDHGPYVAGRQFDLNESTAAAIGFLGLGDVKYRILP
jgi:hypothetical protein